MLTEPEGRIIRILDKILSYISVVIILSIFIYATFTIIDRLLSLFLKIVFLLFSLKTHRCLVGLKIDMLW